MIEIINPYVVKILMAAKDGDSIRAISNKINLSYAWTYKWVNELVKLGIFKRSGQEIFVKKENQMYMEFMGFIKKMFTYNLTLDDAYTFPNLTGLEHAFTSTDAVFIWTKGGYNIGRNMDNYPIFIEVLEKDVEQWLEFFNFYSINATRKIERKKGIYLVIMPKEKIIYERVDGLHVIPLSETVAYAKKYIYNFEPALEMLNEMYSLGLDIRYAEKSS